MPATIKLSQLKNACQPQQDLFRRLFGAEVHLTLDLAKQYAPDFDFNWAAEYLLPAPLWAEYERQKAPRWAEYERQKAQIFTTLYLEAP